MKKFYAVVVMILVMCATVYVAGLAVSHITGAALNGGVTQAASTVSAENECDNTITEGMFFSVEYVTSEHEDGSNEWGFVTYTDPDAGLYEAEICLTWENYAEVVYLIETGQKCWGTLELRSTLEDGTKVYGINCWNS